MTRAAQCQHEGQGQSTLLEVLAALYSCPFPLALPCPVPRASPAVSCARVWLQGSTALALWECSQPTALPWLCCTCTGLVVFITAPSSCCTARENACGRADRVGARAGCRLCEMELSPVTQLLTISRSDLFALPVFAARFMYK